MEIKKQRKRISKGLKKKRILKGGNWDMIKNWIMNVGSNIETFKNELLKTLDEATKRLFESIFNEIKNFEEGDYYNNIVQTEKTEYEKWKTFIETIFIYKCDNDNCEAKQYVDKLKDETDDGKILTKDEAEAMATKLMEKVIIIGRKRNIVPTVQEVPKCDDGNAVDCQNPQQQKLSLEEMKTNLISKFDEILKYILNYVNSYIGKDKIKTDGCSNEFKKMISLLRAVPNIENNLVALIKDNGNDINTLKDRYNAILRLLKGQCSSIGMSFICNIAAKALGKDIENIYIKLKGYSEQTNTTDDVDDDKLIDFIGSILPIMKKNLEGIKVEFKDANIILQEIEEELKKIKENRGGKKSSGAVRKEILGKLMTIYKIPNDKKEYVRHKGYLISIKQYKEEVKAANHAKPRKPAKPAKATKKLILGKERCIYKVQGSKKDHIKYKGALIPVADYKKLMGA